MDMGLLLRDYIRVNTKLQEGPANVDSSAHVLSWFLIVMTVYRCCCFLLASLASIIHRRDDSPTKTSTNPKPKPLAVVKQLLQGNLQASSCLDPQSSRVGFRA